MSTVTSRLAGPKVVLSLLLLSACGATPLTAQTTTAGDTTSSPAATAPSSAPSASELPPSGSQSAGTTATPSHTVAPVAAFTCSADQLVGAVASQDGGAGHVHVVVLLTNKSGRDCTMHGAPALSWVGASGPRALVTRGTDVTFTAVKAGTVTLKPGQSGSFDVGYSRIPRGEQTCVNGTSMLVTPPSTNAAVPVAFPIDACGDVGVSTVVAGAVGVGR